MLVALIAPTATMAIPPTTDFMNTLTVCATNFDVHLDADVLGSIRTVYEGDRTQGKVAFKTATEFLTLFPESQRADIYKVYVNCVLKILAPS